MTIYKPTIADNLFLINDVLNAAERTKDIPAFAALDAEMMKMVIDTAATFVVKTAHPLNRSGDIEGCKYDPATKQVTVPAGFKEAFDEWRATGFIGLEGSIDFGGFGMPNYLAGIVSEFRTGANFSQATYDGLTGGAAKILEHFGNDEMKAKYLPKMYAGEATGTMCLTEPGSGSDLGGITTMATPQADGSYKVSGDKIFITSGEHNIAGNIYHFVLARTPGAPEGTRGISLFLVPKLDTETGAANGVTCTGIEHKMGINGSATCSMNFDGAKGYLVGNLNEGLKAMFTMMNDARQNVARQGLSMAEVAWQNAVEYAKIRVQGKKISEAFNDKAKPVAIINHANIKADLLEMRAQIEGWRALLVESSIQLDIANHHPDAAKRKEADEIASLLTPALKAGCTDLGCSVAQRCIQIHGGMGYIGETGVEQFYRDALIGTIYEGTNDIQAMDFTFRKVLDIKNPNRLKGYLAKIAAESKSLAAGATDEAVKSRAHDMNAALYNFGNAAQSLAATAMKGDLDDVHIRAREFNELFGKLAVGHMWLKMAKAASDKMAADPSAADMCQKKLDLAAIYFKRILMPAIAAAEYRVRGVTVDEIKKAKPNHFDF